MSVPLRDGDLMEGGHRGVLGDLRGREAVHQLRHEVLRRRRAVPRAPDRARPRRRAHQARQRERHSP